MPQTEVGEFEHDGKTYRAEGMSHDGKGNFSAYQGKDGALQNWKGKTVLDLRMEIVGNFMQYEIGTDYLALVYKLPSGRGWLVACSMGEGMLVRGEYVEGNGFYDDDEAKRFALQVTESWIEADQEDFERDQEEQREETERELEAMEQTTL